MSILKYWYGLLLVVSIGLTGCGGAPETGNLPMGNQPPVPDVVESPAPGGDAEEPIPDSDEDAGSTPNTDEGIEPDPETAPQMPVFPEYPGVSDDYIDDDYDVDDYVPDDHQDDDDYVPDDEQDDEGTTDVDPDLCSVLEQVTGR